MRREEKERRIRRNTHDLAELVDGVDWDHGHGVVNCLDLTGCWGVDYRVAISAELIATGVRF